MEEYYRHFKGNVYRVLHIAKHSETLEEMVVYQAMYGERGIWVRPKSMFEEEIERDGKTFRPSPLFLQRKPRKLSTTCRTYRKKLYLCIPFEKRGQTADVAQPTRARDL